MHRLDSAYGHHGYSHRAQFAGQEYSSCDAVARHVEYGHRAAFARHGYEQHRLPATAFIKEGALTFGAVSTVASGALGALIGMVTGGPAAALALGTAMAVGGGISGAISGAITGAAVAATNPGSHSDIAHRAALVAGTVGVVSNLLFSGGSVASHIMNAVSGGAIDYLIGGWMGKRLAKEAAGW